MALPASIRPADRSLPQTKALAVRSAREVSTVGTHVYRLLIVGILMGALAHALPARAAERFPKAAVLGQTYPEVD
jgi:hypothetical protein